VINDLQIRVAPMSRWIKAVALLVITVTVLSTGARAHSGQEHGSDAGSARPAVDAGGALLAPASPEQALSSYLFDAGRGVIQCTHSPHKGHVHNVAACCCQGAAPCSTSGGAPPAHLNATAWPEASAAGSSRMRPPDARSKSEAPRLRLDRPPEA
jgi:hypothetical protein